MWLWIARKARLASSGHVHETKVCRVGLNAEQDTVVDRQNVCNLCHCSAEDRHPVSRLGERFGGRSLVAGEAEMSAGEKL